MMVRLTVIVLLMCLATIGMGSHINDDLDINTSLDHDHSDHQHDHSDSSDSDSDDSHDHHHHHHLEQGLDLTNGSCIEKAERVLKYLWQRYKARFAKRFSHAEEPRRLALFKVALEKIQKHNCEADLGMHTFQMGLNELSCATPEEMKQRNGLIADTTRNLGNEYEPSMPLSQFPASLDYRTLNLVTPVKDQGQCGSCYTFAAIGAIEAQLRNTTGNPVSLSEQQLLDCSTNSKYGNKGCNGGVCNWAFQYAKDTGFIVPGTSYPYKAKVESCNPSQQNAVPRTHVSSWINVQPGSEASLKEVLWKYGPVAAAVDASSQAFKNYHSGVYKGTSDELDHAVLVIGYGTQNNEDYWLVKNSWGTTWGEGGYFKVARNSPNPKANMGLTKQASAPQLSTY